LAKGVKGHHFARSLLLVIPAKAGIQHFVETTHTLRQEQVAGFRLSPE
jgi:hypothetical protein